MRGKPLILKKLDNGCIIPISHKLNKDNSHLASLFCVSFFTACKWVREWKV